MANKKILKKKEISKSKTTRLFGKIIIAFAILAVILVLLIIYFSFSKTVITIIPQPQEAKYSFQITVKKDLTEEEKNNNEAISGIVLETNISDKKTSVDLSAQEKVPAQAKGQVIIYNNWSQTQPLAANTRLLSKEGILFKTKLRVDVPARGQVEAEVYADQEGESGNIGPTKFEIVALSAELKQKIYAESTSPMTSGLVDKKIVTQENLDKAYQDLTNEMLVKAKSNLAEQLKKENSILEIDEKVLTYQVIEKKSTPEVGKQADELTVELKLKVAAVAFLEQDLKTIAQNKLSANVPEGQLLTSKEITVDYSLDTYNLNDQTATLKVTVTGESIVQPSSPIFDKSNLIKKSKQEIINYFKDFEEIKNVQVSFSPFWVFKSSSTPSQIEIKIVP
jgi:hypothetical protein